MAFTSFRPIFNLARWNSSLARPQDRGPESAGSWVFLFGDSVMTIDALAGREVKEFWWC